MQYKIQPYFFSSMSLPSWRQDWRPMVISVNMSAIFFCISWFLASGTPNWILMQKTTLLFMFVNKKNLKRIINITFKQTKKLKLHYSDDFWHMHVWRLTCQVCTVELHGNRTLQHPERPKQYHNERCSSSRRDPEATNVEWWAIDTKYFYVVKL